MSDQITKQAITLANLSEKTDQEVFDYIAAHLLSQGKRAAKKELNFNGHPICRYRTQDGLRCAAGCLIAPDEYKPEFEGESWYGVVTHNPEITRAHEVLIGELQNVHDSKEVAKWPEEINAVAEKYNLQPHTRKAETNQT